MKYCVKGHYHSCTINIFSREEWDVQGFIEKNCHYKMGRKLTVKKLGGGGGITSLALTPHAVFTVSKGGVRF